MGGGAARHTPEEPGDPVVRTAAAALPPAALPLPSPVSASASHGQRSHVSSWASGPPQDVLSAPLQRTENLRPAQVFGKRGVDGQGTEMSFPFPKGLKTPTQESILDLLSVGSHLGSPKWVALPLGLVHASFPLSYLPANQCVTIASG